MTVSEFINKVGFQVDQNSVNQVNSTISSIKSTATKVLGAIGIGISLSSLNSIAEEFNQINDRINAIVDSEENAKEVQESILEAANACKTSYSDMASTVESLYNMNSELFPIEDATAFAEYVQKIGLSAGYTDSEISSMQSSLQRIIASGSASSNDITRMLRNTPALAKQLAESLGVATDELSSMAEAGELTAQTIKDAILGSAEAIDEAFDQLDYSVSDAMLNIRNQWGFWVDDLNSSLEITQTIAKTMVKGFNALMSVLNPIKDGLVKLNDLLGGGNNLFKLIAIAAAAFFTVMAWPTVIAQVKKFLGLFTKVGNLFHLSTMGALALIAVIIMLALVVEDFINFMQGNDSVIGYCFQRAGIDAEEMRQKIVDIWNNLKSFFSGLWNSIKAIFEPALNWIKQKLEDVFGEDLFAGVGNGLEAIIVVLERFTEALANNEGLQDTIAKIAVAIVGIVAAVKMLGGITGTVSKFGSAFSKVASAITGTSKTAVATSGSGKGVSGFISSFFSGFANLKITTVLKGIANLGIVLAGITAMAAGIMALSPYLAQLSDASSLLEVLVVIAVVGLLGVGLAELAGIVGNIPVSTVTKGLANIAIVLVGIGALSAAVMALAGPLARLSSGGEIAKLLAVITSVGLVGSALAVLAGIVGIIPMALVISGLADIALAIGGFSLIAAAYGALAAIPGFNALISGGLDALSVLANGIGNFIGSLIGGIGEGVTNSLPAIGENLSAFAESIQPFFEICGNTDMSGVSEFLSAFGSFVLQMTASDLLSAFTGGTDLSAIGEQLVAFAESASGFFEWVATLPEEGLTRAGELFEALSGMGNVMKTGGIAQLIMGQTDYGQVAESLASLASDGVVAFFNMVSQIPSDAFDNASALFESLSGMGKIMRTGGIAQFFTGDADYSKVAQSLEDLTSEGVRNFYSMVGEFSEETFTGASALFESLSGMGKIMRTGGIAQFFTGNSDYSKVADALEQLTSEGVRAFYSMVAKLPSDAFEKGSELFDSLSGMGTIMRTGGVAQFFTGNSDYSKVAEALEALSQSGVVTFFRRASTLSSSSFTNAVELFQALSDISNIEIGDIDTSSVNGDGLADFAADVQSFFAAISEIDVSSLTKIESALTNLVSRVQAAANTVDQSFGTIETTVSSVTADVVSAINDSWDSVENNTDTVFGRIGTSIRTGLTTARTYAVSACNAIKTSILNVFNGLPATMTTMGTNLMQGLANGIKNGTSTVVNAMKNAMNQAIQAGKSEADINSPSKRAADEIGEYLPEGVAVGVEENQDTATSAMSSMIDSLFSGVSSVKDTFSSAFSGIQSLAGVNMVSPMTAQTAAGGSTDNSRNVSQNVNINNTFNGDKAIQQKAASAMDSAAEDVTATLARGLAYAR